MRDDTIATMPVLAPRSVGVHNWRGSCSVSHGRTDYRVLHRRRSKWYDQHPRQARTDLHCDMVLTCVNR
jgi:hypothetical protein